MESVVEGVLSDRLRIEFGSYFVSLGPINMRALPCNRETTWAATPQWCPDAGVAADYEEAPVVMPRGCRHIAEPR